MDRDAPRLDKRKKLLAAADALDDAVRGTNGIEGVATAEELLEFTEILRRWLDE